MSIIRITEGMRKDPKIELLGEKTIGKYKISITKSKAWFHKYADWEIIIIDTKSQKKILHSSHSDKYSDAQKATNSLERIKTIKDVKSIISQPSILYK